MATARGRRVNRVSIYSFNELHSFDKTQTVIATQAVRLYSIGATEAEQLAASGELRKFNGRFYRTGEQKKAFRSNSNLTLSDMEGLVMNRRRAVERVQAWPDEHDRRNLTIIAGRGYWQPDAADAAIRAKMRQQEHQLRRQDECKELRKQMLNAKGYADAARN